MVMSPIGTMNRTSFNSLLFLLVTFINNLSQCRSSSFAGGLSLSPIKHLEGSVAASSARGSVAAVRCSQNDQECVVVVLLRPSTNSNILPSASQALEQENKPAERMFGLTLSLSTASNRWIQLGGSSVCTMTGFAADIQHLTGVAMEQVESHQALYSQSMSVDRVVRSISDKVQRAARSQGGRPYGIQALIVGLDNSNSFQLYTIDPAGGWQHYGGGATAIGREAKEVRARLYKELKNDGSTEEDDSNAFEALRMAISSLVGESIKGDDNKEDFSDKLEALLVWKSDRNSCCVRRIEDSEVEACLNRIVEKQ